jgi:hypothetical protein
MNLNSVTRIRANDYHQRRISVLLLYLEVPSSIQDDIGLNHYPVDRGNSSYSRYSLVDHSAEHSNRKEVFLHQ